MAQARSARGPTGPAGPLKASGQAMPARNLALAFLSRRSCSLSALIWRLSALITAARLALSVLSLNLGVLHIGLGGQLVSVEL